MKKLFLLFWLLAGLLGAHGQAGSLDPSFAGKGWTFTDFLKTPFGDLYEEVSRDVLVQDDGSIIVVLEINEHTILARYLSNGTLDANFGAEGFSDVVYLWEASAAFQSDGKIVVAGQTMNLTTFSNDFALVRYLPDGSLDQTFGEGGKVLTDLGGSDGARDIVVQSDDKIIVAGHAGTDFALARYNANGSLDVTFDGDGKVVTDFGHIEGANALALSNGKIVVAGQSFNASTQNLDVALARYNTDGSLDATFDGDGKVTTDFGSNEFARDVAFYNGGKIVVVGPGLLARYNSNGTLDNSFDGDGRVTTDLGRLYSIAVQNDGKIVVGGYVDIPGLGSSDVFLARYLPNGSPDASFDEDGIAAIDFAGGANEDFAHVIALSNGKIVVAGYAYINSPEESDFALARFDPDGSLDESFGGDGSILGYYPVGRSTIEDIAVQSDGKIVVVGRAYHLLTASYIFGVARYHPDGTLDASFDGDGIVTTDLGGADEYVTSVAIQSDGKIVVAGYVENNNLDFALVRFNPNGTLDASFDGDGKVITDFGESDQITSIALQSDGKIVVAGSTRLTSSSFAVARYNSNGSLDNSFDGDGKVTTPIGFSAIAYSIAVQGDGKIVVAGNAFDFEAGANDFALARYNTDGSLDNTFDGDGKLTKDFGLSEIARALTLQSDGKIVVAGSANIIDSDNSDFVLARFHPDGSPDVTFDGDGMVLTNFGYSETAYDVELQSDGKIVATGVVFNRHTERGDFGLARYHPDGTLDNSFDGDGKVITDFGFSETAYASAIHSGRLYAAGTSRGVTERGLLAAYRLGVTGAEVCGNKIDDNGDGQIDEGCPGLPFLTVDDITVPESQRRAVVTVRLSKKTDQKVFVDYFTRGGTARVKAFKNEGRDYEAASGTLSIPVGKQSVSFVVKITSDEVWEKDEYFKVQLHNAVGATIRKAQATVTIADDDALQVAPALTGIDAKEEKEGVGALGVKAVPNPSATYFTLIVQGSGNAAAATIRVMDAAGRLVESRQGVAANTTLQIGHNYRPGVYYVEVVQGKERVVVQLVKQTQ